MGTRLPNMTVMEIYAGSNGDETKALYDKLQTLGVRGVVALNLFRANKASSRAKVYRGGGWKGLAYDRKNWSLGLLCLALKKCSDLVWGWKQDEAQAFHKWVLYVELPQGQVSFHAQRPLSTERYAGEWDGCRVSAERIIHFVDDVLKGEL